MRLYVEGEKNEFDQPDRKLSDMSPVTRIWTGLCLIDLEVLVSMDWIDRLVVILSISQNGQHDSKPS